MNQTIFGPLFALTFRRRATRKTMKISLRRIWYNKFEFIPKQGKEKQIFVTNNLKDQHVNIHIY